jgi:hypothetical protein
MGGGHLQKEDIMNRFNSTSTWAGAAILALVLTGCNIKDNNVNVNIAPQITVQPVSVTVSEGSNATFNIGASGDDLSFQWVEETSAGDVEVPGAVSATLTVTSVTTTTHNGKKYKCKVRNPHGEVVTNTVTLTVTATVTAPQITAQPTNVTVSAGSNATFTVTASGESLTFQWVENDTDTISGAVSATLTITSVTTAHNGKSYKCVVRNPHGTVTTISATLSVTATALWLRPFESLNRRRVVQA